MTQTVLGLCTILGLVIVNASQHRVNWTIAGTWLWIGIIAVIFITGMVLIWLSLTRRLPEQK